MSEGGSRIVDNVLRKLGIKRGVHPPEPQATPKRPLFSEETQRRIVNNEPSPKKPERLVGPREVPKAEEPKEEWRIVPGSGKIE